MLATTIGGLEVIPEKPEGHDSRAKTLTVVWRVYEQCSLHCRFCTYGRPLDRPPLAADADTILRFGSILGEYRQQHNKSVHVSWLGGEPLQWPHLPYLSRRLSADFGLALGITTNGLPLANPSVRAMLVRDYEQVTVSVDGSRTFHDWVRGMDGLFPRIKENIQRLNRNNQQGSLLMRVNTVLMRDNIGMFAEFCHEMADWGFRELTFNQLGGRDRPDFYADHFLLPEQVERFCKELPGLRQRMLDVGLLICGTDRYLTRLLCSSRGESISVDECWPGSRYLFIDEHGLISPCSFTGREYGIPLASIHSANDLCELPARFARIRRTNRASHCNDCLATHVFDKFSQ